MVCSTKDIRSLQISLTACFGWAALNHLAWNPAKSQILDVHPSDEEREAVYLGAVQLQWAEIVEYLGLRLTKEGFLGKDPALVEEKGNAALHMLTSEVWFDLNVEPKYIAREYLYHVRRTMLYGAELLRKEARIPFLEIDEKLTNLFLVKLLNLGRNKLAKKHQWRLQVVLGITTLSMDIDKSIHNCINTWIEKRMSCRKQISDRANESLQDILKLEPEHPLREALRLHIPRVGKVQGHKMVAWVPLEQESSGAQPNQKNRPLRAAQSTSKKNTSSLTEEPNLHGELRKAALHWSVYRFSVNHAPKEDQERLLRMMTDWQSLNETQKDEVKLNLFGVYNYEERGWGRAPLRTPSRPDIRSRENTANIT